MHNEHSLNGGAERADPLEEPIHVRMTADSVKALDPGMDLDRLAEKFDILLPFKQPAPQCPICLISDKEYRTFGPPEIVLQMVSYTPRVTHARSGYDHLWLLYKIDHLRVITCGRYVQPGENKGIHS